MNGFVIAISIIIIIILAILGTRLDTKIIETFYNTDFSNNFQILENNNGQQFNLIDSTISFFTPKIFRPSSYRGTNNNKLSGNQFLYNTAININNDTKFSNIDQEYPVCRNVDYTPENAVRPEWNDNGVYAMCGSIPIYRWSGNSNLKSNIGNCNNDANNGRQWGTCESNLSTISSITISNPDTEYPVCRKVEYTPQNAINSEWNDTSIYAMCGSIPIYRWGMSSAGEQSDIGKCNYDANNSERKSPYRWGKCSDHIIDKPICKYFNYTNNNNLRYDWSSGGFYATCDNIPIAKSDRKNKLKDEKDTCDLQALQGRWGKCSDKKYLQRPVCNRNYDGKISLTCRSTSDEKPIHIAEWLNDNITDCANYAIRLPNCRDIFQSKK